MSRNTWATAEGTNYPLGVTYLPAEQAYNFALYSKHATQVILRLYGADDLVKPLQSITFDYPPHKSGRVWHCRLPAAMVEQAYYYAYTVDGPFAVEQEHRFDRKKFCSIPMRERFISRRISAGPLPPALVLMQARHRWGSFAPTSTLSTGSATAAQSIPMTLLSTKCMCAVLPAGPTRACP